MKQPVARRGRFWFTVCLTALACLIAAFASRQSGPDRSVCTVALIPADGMTILSENPVQVKNGGSASFAVEVHDPYLPDETSALRYEDGVLYVDHVTDSMSVRYTPRRRCRLTVAEEGAKYVTFLSGNDFLTGDMAEIRVDAPEHYTAGTVLIGGETYNVPSTGIVAFPVYEDGTIVPVFTGDPVSFTAAAYPAGSVRAGEEKEQYRYGDTVTLTAVSGSGEMRFSGWSSGAPVKDGGVFLSADTVLTYTLASDTELYANFTDTHTISVYIDSNGGAAKTALTITDCSAGVPVYLPADTGTLRRDGCALTGYNTLPDGSGRHYALSSPVTVGGSDMVLYAEWLPETAPDALKYYLKDGHAVVTGVKRDIGDTLVIPATLGGAKVKVIEGNFLKGNADIRTVLIPLGVTYIGDGAFSGCSHLSTVYLPDTVESLGGSAFGNCPSFAHLRVLTGSDIRVYEKTFHAAQVDKYRRLLETEGKRIILVSGSSGSYGLNSAVLSERFPDYTVINFSGSYLFGIQPLAYYVMNHVHEGDVVIFAPEYFTVMYANEVSRELSNWEYIESDFNMLDDLDLQQVKRTTLGNFVKFFAEKRKLLPNKQSATLPFARAAFNEYGDIATVRTHRKDVERSYPDAALINRDCVAFYTMAFSGITAKGGVCLFSFPPVSEGDSSHAALAPSYESFTKKLTEAFSEADVTVISNAADYLFPSRSFYDNKYHMTSDGAVLRTEQLIADLEAYGLGK